MKKKDYTKEQVEKAIQSGSMLQAKQLLGCSKGTVENYLKRYAIKTTKGFYHTGKQVGCPKGTKRTPEQIEAMSERAKGEKNPFFGKLHSEKTKELMKSNHADFSGDNNPFKQAIVSRPELLQELSEKQKQRWSSYTNEQRNEISRKFSLAQNNNKYHKNNASFKNHIHGHYKSKKGGEHFFRSSWELKVAQALDEHQNVDTYEYEPYTISYTDENSRQRYSRPDFLAVLKNKSMVLVEVKPESLLDLNNNRSKIAGYRIFCAANKIAFLLVHKQQLDELKEIFDVERFERPGVDSVLHTAEEVS